MLLAETQEAAILLSLIFAIGMALLSRLLFKPKDQQVLKTKQPNTPSERGSFIPLVLGTRRVGAVVLYVGDRITTQQVVGGDSKSGDITQTVYWEKAIHALCVGPCERILGIYIDGWLVPNSQFLTKDNAIEGLPTTFPKVGTMRIYWGTLNSAFPSLLQQVLGLNTDGPYVCRVEWDRFRLGFGTRWPLIEYIVEVKCVGDDSFDGDPLGSGINPAQALVQLLTAEYPHGAGLDPDWIDYNAVGELAALATAEGISFNMVILDGESLDSVLGSMMQDMGFMLIECNGVLAPYPIRRITDSVPLLTNDLLKPPIDEVERVHISRLGDALIYQYVDRELNYRTGTIDIDDDTGLGIRNQRKTKKISIENVTERNVASVIASRRQIEDLTDYASIKVKGLRTLRSALPGHPFDVPGIGRVRLLSYKPLFNEPTVELELLADPFDQDPIEYTDPSNPDAAEPGQLAPDIRFDTYELPYIATRGTATLATFRHRANKSITVCNIWTSGDGVNYVIEGAQAIACGGGVLAADFDTITRAETLEVGPDIAIDPNGDEDLPVNLTPLPNSWVSGTQIMAIGSDPRKMEFFFVRDWIEITPNTLWRPLGLIRARYGRGVADPPFYDGGRHMKHLAGEPCYLINYGSVTKMSGGSVETASVQTIKAQPGSADGVVPLAAVVADSVQMTSEGTITPPFPWFTCGGSWAAKHPVLNTGRRDNTWAVVAISNGGGFEDIIFEFIPGTKGQGAGFQGAGQPVQLTPIQGSFRIEVYMDEESNANFDFDQLQLVNTYNVPDISTLLQPSGVYSFTYTHQNIVDDGVLAGFPPVALEWTDRLGSEGGTGLIWKFLLYHNDGTLSPPRELRPHAWVNNTAVENYLVGIGTDNS